MREGTAARILQLGLAVMMPLGVARSQVGAWATTRIPTAPGPIAFDCARGRLVLFPATSTGAQLSEAFEWQGAWQHRASATRPARRVGHAMAYDAARRRVVLFGGSTSANTAFFADTWLWDGFDWTQAPVTVAPSPRQSAALAFDSIRNRIVLFGGGAAFTSFGDTWLWDGTAWTQAVSAVQPQPRSGAAMAFDRLRGVAVMFGGSGLSDTWTWNGAQWTAMAPPTSPSGVEPAMANDDARNVVVLQLRGASFDTYEWNGANWTLWSNAADPAKGMAFDANRGRVVAHAGGGRLSEWNGAAWTVVDDGVPYGGGALASDYATSSLTLLGQGPGGAVETWSYRDRHWQRSRPATSPPGFGMFAADPNAGRTLLLGGSSGSTTRNETWEWNGVTWRNMAPLASPPARDLGGLAFHQGTGRMVLFGGMLPNGTPVNDTWVFDGVTWTQMQPQNRPSPRLTFGIAGDLLRDRVVVFGGTNLQTRFGDTWEWDGTNWSQRAVTGPVARTYPGLDFDLVRGKVVLFGGETNGVAVNDTWAWDGVAWSTVPVTGPAVSTVVVAMAHDLGSDAHVAMATDGAIRSLEAGAFAAAAVVGTGCGGSAGPLEHRSDLPYLGNSQFALAVRNVVPGTPCLIAVSTALQPVDLGSGCTSYLAQPFGDVFLAIGNAAGVAQVRIPIPASAMLLGASACTQAGALDPQGPLGGISLSNAMQVTIGR